MIRGICRLCLQNKELINKSHILSDFFFDNIYGDDHEAYRVPLNALKEGKKIHTGEFEGGLLCQECDNCVLGGYENYGSKFIFGRRDKKPLPNVNAETQLHADNKLKSTFITGIDYKKLKLFMLSLLWRASVSSRPFFAQVQLGRYEEEIRRMLLNGVPGEQMMFPTMVNVIVGQNHFVSKQIISSPTKFRDGHCIAYQFHVGRLIFMYYVSPSGIPDAIKEVALTEKGEMRVVHLDGDISDSFMKFVLGKELHEYLVQNISKMED